VATKRRRVREDAGQGASAAWLSPEELQARLKLLKSATVLAGLNTGILTGLAANLTVLELARGERIFRKGDPCDSMYIVAAGSVRIHDGKYTFTQIDPPGSFGEYAIVQGSTRTASATARCRTTVFKVDCALIHRQFGNNCDFVQGLLKAVLSRVLEKDCTEMQICQNRREIKRQRDQITRQRDAMEKQHEQLVHMQAVRDKFFEVVVHDLKNPLMGLNILSRNIALEKKTLTLRKAQTYTRMVCDTVANSSRLLENLLDWWRSQTDDLQFVIDAVNLHRTVRDSLALQATCAQQKRITMHNQVPQGVLVLADARSLFSVLRNLTANAVKYTNPGGHVTVAAEPIKNCVEITVSDTGVGIDPQRLKRVFRGAPGFTTCGTAGEAGTGLGLKLCREFVKRSHGTIRVASEPGKGTTFTVRLRRSERAI
jgi:signal transduction histidine kinase